MTESKMSSFFTFRLVEVFFTIVSLGFSVLKPIKLAKIKVKPGKLPPSGSREAPVTNIRKFSRSASSKQLRILMKLT